MTDNVEGEMSNTGFVEISLLHTDGLPARDPDTRFEFRSTNGVSLSSARSSLDPAARFELPAFPTTGKLTVALTPERYLSRSAPFFLLLANETVERRLTVLRDPGAWKADFVGYAELPVEFDRLKRLLEESGRIRLIGGGVIGALVGAEYDGVSGSKKVLAKAALLNLFLKLRCTRDPLDRASAAHEPRRFWIDYVRRVLEIDRERFVAIADPAVLDAVAAAPNAPADEDGIRYKKAPSVEHFRNYPTGYTVTRSRVVSVKTREADANLQVTVAPAKDADGNQVVLMDADIDESGTLIGHLADLVEHTFTGGTHPYFVHDLLGAAFPRERFGYDLV